MKSKRCCPICGKRDVELLHNQAFVLPENHPLNDGYAVVACDTCGFVYADTTVDQKDYDLFYSQFSKYSDSRTSTGGGGNPLDKKRLKETASFLAGLVPNLNARVLDIGCATGGLLLEMAELGFTTLWGIDPSESCVYSTNQIPGVHANVGSLSQIPEGIGKFDLIVLSHVLEHVQCVRETQGIISNLTKEQGLVYVEVPDATRYRDYIVAPFQDFNTEHINHFSKTSLRNYLARGWLVKETGEKLIDLGGGMSYPAAYIVAQKDENNDLGVIEKETFLKSSVQDYISISSKKIAIIDSRLREVLNKKESIIVYGTGQLALKLLTDTCLKDAKIEFFVDGNALNQGKKLAGGTVFSPEKIRESTAPVLVASLVNSISIKNDIRALGIRNEVIDLAGDK